MPISRIPLRVCLYRFQGGLRHRPHSFSKHVQSPPVTVYIRMLELSAIQNLASFPARIILGRRRPMYSNLRMWIYQVTLVRGGGTRRNLAAPSQPPKNMTLPRAHFPEIPGRSDGGGGGGFTGGSRFLEIARLLRTVHGCSPTPMRAKQSGPPHNFPGIQMRPDSLLNYADCPGTPMGGFGAARFAIRGVELLGRASVTDRTFRIAHLLIAAPASG